MRDETKTCLFFGAVLMTGVLLLNVRDHALWRAISPQPALQPAKPLGAPFPPADFNEFLARYGPPTSEERVEGRIQPPLFTRWLDYEPEHIRVAFIATESPGQDRRWIMISIVDANRTSPISREEAGERLRSRQK